MEEKAKNTGNEQREFISDYQALKGSYSNIVSVKNAGKDMFALEFLFAANTEKAVLIDKIVINREMLKGLGGLIKQVLDQKQDAQK